MVAAVSIASLLQPSQVVLGLGSVRRAAAIHAVAARLEGHPAVAHFAGFYADLLARERLDTTCLGNGVALPHARTEHVRSLVLAVGRSDEGIRFEAQGEPVQLVFVVGTPKAHATAYLQAVSSICRLLKVPETRSRLLAAPTAEAFLDVIRQAEAPAAALAPAGR